MRKLTLAVLLNHGNNAGTRSLGLHLSSESLELVLQHLAKHTQNIELKVEALLLGLVVGMLVLVVVALVLLLARHGAHNLQEALREHAVTANRKALGCVKALGL